MRIDGNVFLRCHQTWQAGKSSAQKWLKTGRSFINGLAGGYASQLLSGSNHGKNQLDQCPRLLHG